MKFYDETKLNLNTDMKVTGVVALGSSTSQAVGKNKSGKPWTKNPTRSTLHVPFNKLSEKAAFNKRMEQKRALKVLQERTKEIKQRHFEERRA